MSQVVDIILVTALDDSNDGEASSVKHLNRWCEEHCGWGHGSGYLQRVDDHAGGGKAMQCEVWIAAVNMLDIEAFVAAFRAIPWGYPENTMLMLKDEFDEQFTVYTVDGLPSMSQAEADPGSEIPGEVGEYHDTPWTRLDQAIREYVQGLEQPGGDVEDPSLLIEDAIQGLLSDDDLLDMIVKAREFTHSRRRAEGCCEWCSAPAPEHWDANCKGAKHADPA